MNREIKFRAWETTLKIMAPVQEIYYLNGEVSHVQLPAHQNRTNICYINLMQFTGVKDQNDKEVFEGDILTWPHLSEPKK